MKNNIINSVLGFNLNVDITDENGNLINKGIKYTIKPEILPKVFTSKIFDRSFFTHFNEDLLNKIRQHRRLND